MAAARAAGEAAGLEVRDPHPVGTGSNVIVHLRPHAVVARVMTGTAVLHDDPEAWLRRELDVGRHLVAAGAPVVGPVPGIDAGPCCVDGLWISLWEHVDCRPEPVPARVAGEALARLHAAPRTYRGELPPRSAVGAELDRLLADAAAGGVAAGADLAALRDEREALRAVIAGDAEPAHALHGDASLGNLLHTADGPRFDDLEDVCHGWVGWDVGTLYDDVLDRRGPAEAAALLDGYGPGPDAAELEPVLRVSRLYGLAWQLHLAGRGAVSRTAAAARLAAWRRAGPAP